MTRSNETRSTSRRHQAWWIAGFLLVSTSAGAKPTVPGDLKAALHMPCAPPCTICHQTMQGGRGTATKPLVNDFVNHGFVVDPEPNVAETIKNYPLIPGDDDADHDGIDDLTELRDGTDPDNPAKGASLCGPEYGCVRVARGGVDGVASVLGGVVLAAGVVLMRRRAQKRR